ncbi:MAG: DUF3488 domain-containing protein [Planctomycetales bacterium]|nr:DUF3488 domain-containing protein [Planctomycetales bacterium]
MDKLQRRLSINLAALAVLGSFLLGMGQQDFRLPLLTLLVAVVSLQLTDLRGLFQLNRTVANLAALVAVALSAYDFTRLARADQLLAIANLLVYLQVVVFFQKKTPRIHWQLAMLSLLQVVVAAALNYSMLFGVLLVLYMCLGIFAMAQIFVYREAAAFADREAAASETNRNSQTHAIVALGRTGRLAELADVRRLLRMTAKVGLTTMVVTLLLFFTIPRFGKSALRGFGQAERRMVGYSQDIELGDLGQIVENPETVMQLQLFEGASDEPFRLTGEPYLRGSVLTTYRSGKSRGRNGSSQWRPSRINARLPTRRLPVPRNPGQYVRQRVLLEPLNEPVVFGIYPVFGLGPEDFVRYDGERSQMVRWPLQLHQTRFEVELGTSGVAKKRQTPIVPDFQVMSDIMRQEYLQMPEPGDAGDPLAELKTRARQVVAQSQAPADDAYLVAQAIEAHLRASGEYEYTLKRTEQDSTLDPLEDFIAKNRNGHCEYFASALVMMLRSQGIPSRLIIGYKGGEWNDLGQYYQFRQLHAHTWVEAYLRADQLKGRQVDLGGATGGWLRLDPTTSSGAEEANGILSGIGQVLDYVETLWMRNIVGLDAQRQERSIYTPLRDAGGVLSSLTAPRAWMAWLADRNAAFKAWLGGSWLSWRGLLLLLIVVLATYSLYRLIRRLAIFSLFHRRRGQTGPGNAPEVEFYRRLETALRREGIVRPATQTQREFACCFHQQGPAPDERLDAVAALAQPLVETFYRVRFGEHALDSSEQEEVEQSLRKIDAALAR